MSSGRAFILAARAGSRLASSSSRSHPRSTPLSLSFASILHQRSLVSSLPSRSLAFHPSSTRRAYSTSAQDPSLSPLGRTLITTIRVIQNVVVYGSSTLFVGFFIWAGTHAYLENYKCPSPQGASSAVQNCLHGAWVREEIALDPSIAEIYYNRALELTRQEIEQAYRKEAESNPEIDDRTRFLKLEKDKVIAEVQSRLARLYARTGQDERAATLWTRLWKLSDRKIDTAAEEKSGSSFSISSLFGGSSAQRTLITKEDGIRYSKLAADCWMRLGEYELAEEALAWTLSNFTAIKNTRQDESSSDSIEEVGLLSTLGTLYVRQQQFEYALSLFVKALQLVQGHRGLIGSNDIDHRQQGSTPKSKSKEEQEQDLWYCREAILMNSIGETLYGAATASVTPSSSSAPSSTSENAKKTSSWKFWSASEKAVTKPKVVVPVVSHEQQQKQEEALGWMQKAIAMAKVKSGQHRDCDECAALGLSNLGLIHEMEGKHDSAMEEFKEAVTYATKAGDFVGIEDYKRNITRLADQISESTVPVAKI
ncbi:hypothetical protein BGZ83_009951 [Gryganskiella cystojenkinii]|nr:hypothetical protein BGZ83_009951 [Gryganskiella cystojenkinii]